MVGTQKPNVFGIQMIKCVQFIIQTVQKLNLDSLKPILCIKTFLDSSSTQITYGFSIRTNSRQIHFEWDFTGLQWAMLLDCPPLYSNSNLLYKQHTFSTGKRGHFKCFLFCKVGYELNLTENSQIQTNLCKICVHIKNPTCSKVKMRSLFLNQN